MKATIAIPSFSKLGLLPEICACLLKSSIEKPTLIQSLAIPSILNTKAHHLIAAQTGTGKTLAYLLPVYQLLKLQEIETEKRLTMSKRPRALFLYPNKNLTKQAYDVMSSLKHDVRLIPFPVYSGQKLQFEVEQLNIGVDILLSTPDRADKHAVHKSLDLTGLDYIVIDEADTLMDAGYIKHIENYINLTKNGKTKMIFVGATLPPNLDKMITKQFTEDDKLSGNYIKRIILKNTHLNLSHLKHDFIQLEDYNKSPTLVKLLGTINPDLGVMIFCNSINSARALEYSLIDFGFSTVSLHGEIPTKQRFANIQNFRERKAKILICTDLGSRGLDFPFLSYVIQYDFPRSTSDYLHRAGRAGRASNPGTVFTLYRKRDMSFIKTLQVSYEKNKPLIIDSSAYSLANKEGVLRTKSPPREKLARVLSKKK